MSVLPSGRGKSDICRLWLAVQWLTDPAAETEIGHETLLLSEWYLSSSRVLPLRNLRHYYRLIVARRDGIFQMSTGFYNIMPGG